MSETPPPPAPPPGEGPKDGSGSRHLAIGLGLGGIVVAIAIAVQSCGDDRAQAPPGTPPDLAAPAAPSEPASSLDPPAETTTPAEAQTAAADQPAPARPAPSRPGRAPALCPQGADRPEILVAFERSHPMNEAQRLFAAGRRDEARALAARLLAERRDLRGLCLARFTIGGAEIVVGAPNPAGVTEWTERLAAMDGVAYAEPNLVASPY